MWWSFIVLNFRTWKVAITSRIIQNFPTWICMKVDITSRTLSIDPWIWQLPHHIKESLLSSLDSIAPISWQVHIIFIIIDYLTSISCSLIHYILVICSYESTMYTFLSDSKQKPVELGHHKRGSRTCKEHSWTSIQGPAKFNAMIVLPMASHGC